jgi:hypothetical protein
MGKKKICVKCKKEYEDTKKEQLKRKFVNAQLKMIKFALPNIEATLEESKNFCYKCYQKTILNVVGPTCKTLLGQMEEAENEKPES